MGRFLLGTFVKFPLFLMGTVLGGLFWAALWGLFFDYLVLRFLFSPSDYLPTLTAVCLIAGLIAAGKSSWQFMYGQS